MTGSSGGRVVRVCTEGVTQDVSDRWRQCDSGPVDQWDSVGRTKVQSLDTRAVSSPGVGSRVTGQRPRSDRVDSDLMYSETTVVSSPAGTERDRGGRNYGSSVFHPRPSSLVLDP